MRLVILSFSILLILSGCANKIPVFDVSGIDLCKSKAYNYKKVKVGNNIYYMVDERDMEEILLDYKIMKINLKNCAGIDCERQNGTNKR